MLPQASKTNCALLDAHSNISSASISREIRGIKRKRNLTVVERKSNGIKTTPGLCDSLSSHCAVFYDPMGSAPESPPIRPIPWMAGDGKAATPQKQEQEHSPLALVVPVPVATEGAAAGGAAAGGGAAVATVEAGGGATTVVVEPVPAAVPFCCMANCVNWA